MEAKVLYTRYQGGYTLTAMRSVFGDVTYFVSVPTSMGNKIISSTICEEDASACFENITRRQG